MNYKEIYDINKQKINIICIPKYILDEFKHKGKYVIDYKAILVEIQKVYLSDSIPWVIGFSGGKDSTTILQMIFYALSELPKNKLTKNIHVLSNDTLVENPVILKYLKKQLKKIEKSGKEKIFKHHPNLFSVVKVKPKLDDTFWVNLIGKGYPSPNRWFRWCTERLKINPTSKYILETVNKNGSAIIVLGSRKAESSNRASSMKNYDNEGRLRKHILPNALVYTPIENLTNNEVWAYLLQAPNPWNSNNRDLLELYSNATSGGECPFVIETGTQSCGKSRFGCWVCTVVDRDKSMENFINNGNVWMQDILNFRNWLYDIRQQTNQYVPVNIESEVKFGPFLLKTRQKILKKLIDLNERIGIQLITKKEIKHIYHLLSLESQAKTKDAMQKMLIELSNGKYLTIISDFNILLTPRKRLGPLYLNNAKLKKSRSVSAKYSNSTRVIYYFA